MNKSDLISNIAHGAGLTKAQAGLALDSVVDSITRAMRKGDTVGLVGFGSFKAALRGARTGRNPKNGAAIEIPRHRTPVFKASPMLKAKLN